LTKDGSDSQNIEIETNMRRMEAVKEFMGKYNVSKYFDNITDHISKCLKDYERTESVIDVLELLFTK